MNSVKEKPGSTKIDPLCASEQWMGVYEEHGRPIYYLCLRILGNPTQAEDAAHDVFLKAFRSMEQFRGESSLRTWLYRIAVNHCRNLMQSWQHRNILTSSEDEKIEDLTPGEDNVLRVLEIKELGERIQKTLDTLPEEYRLLLLLIADQEMSYDEVGALTEQSADAVRGKLYRARKAFIREFKKNQ